MARISRKNSSSQNNSSQNNSSQAASPAKIAFYQTAVYARLSIEDNGVDSDSIDNQIYMLEKFVKERSYLIHHRTFFDNGATGTNFERQGFNDMMNEVRNGAINCIVVKDLSRFGRNYIETGNYLDKIFPYLGVRFISVNDSFDSNESGSNDALVVALKSLLHDIYAKDISRKICTLFEVKKKNGEFLGKFAPYGYEKSLENKHKLVINEERAGIIKDIFKWRLEGVGVTAIARRLNDMGIPSMYKILYEKGAIKGTNGEAKFLWRSASITGILENYNYIGCIVERKTEQAHYKGGRLTTIPKSEWNIIKDTHEPVIDEETFYAVQNLIKNAPKRKIRTDIDITDENILRGIIFCGKCGSRMERDGGKTSAKSGLRYYRFQCGRKYIMSGICDSKGIREDKLKESVLHLLKIQIQVLYNTNETAQKITCSPNFAANKEVLLKELVNLENMLKGVKNLRKSLYEDFRSELLSESEYLYAKSKYEKDSIMFSVKADEIKTVLSSITEVEAPKENNIIKALSHFDDDFLSREICQHLIEKIVFDGHKITVHFTFMSEYDKLLAFINDYADLEAR